MKTEVSAKPNPITVYLLGTGGPSYQANRFGPATLIKVGDAHFLFDAGRGVGQRIYECGIPLEKVDKLFLTHLHSDHTEGLPNLWMAPWFLIARPNLHIWGPPKTKSMTDGMVQMFAEDCRMRPTSFAKKEYLPMYVQEFEKTGVVYDDGAVKITAFEVIHVPNYPAFGFRLEHRGRVVTLTGDTTYHENIITYGKDCDVLVTNVNVVDDARLKHSPWTAMIMSRQTTPEQVADIANKTKPGMTVLSHVSKMGYSGIEGDNRIVERVKACYDGPLCMAYDRMRVELSPDGAIEVFPPNDITNLPDLRD